MRDSTPVIRLVGTDENDESGPRCPLGAPPNGHELPTHRGQEPPRPWPRARCHPTRQLHAPPCGRSERCAAAHAGLRHGRMAFMSWPPPELPLRWLSYAVRDRALGGGPVLVYGTHRTRRQDHTPAAGCWSRMCCWRPRAQRVRWSPQTYPAGAHAPLVQSHARAQDLLHAPPLRDAVHPSSRQVSSASCGKPRPRGPLGAARMACYPVVCPNETKDTAHRPAQLACPPRAGRAV